MPAKKKAITLLSGGLDSMVSTAIAVKKHKVVLALTFDYGQRAAKKEIKASSKLCKLWKIPHKVIKLPWLKEITHTALVDRHHRLPVVGDPIGKTSAKAVWVPNRNALFINIAASFAESLRAELIVAGFNKEEAATFPDNSVSFIGSMNDVLKKGTLAKPSIKSFTEYMNKKDIVRYAIKNSLPLSDCWPCYEGGKELCMKCESCTRFKNAILANIFS